jgi:hypothetical protein
VALSTLQMTVLAAANYQSWNGKPYTHYPTGQPQLTTIKLTIAPYTVLPWCTHPFPNVVYVLSGTLTLHDKASGKTRVVHQGQAAGSQWTMCIGASLVTKPRCCSSPMPALQEFPTYSPCRGREGGILNWDARENTLYISLVERMADQKVTHADA